MPENANIKLPATVEKIIPPLDPAAPEKAQINIQQGADPLYKEIRIENTLVDANGAKVKLKEGAEVELTVEAHPSGIVPKQK